MDIVLRRPPDIDLRSLSCTSLSLPRFPFLKAFLSSLYSFIAVKFGADSDKILLVLSFNSGLLLTGVREENRLGCRLLGRFIRSFVCQGLLFPASLFWPNPLFVADSVESLRCLRLFGLFGKSSPSREFRVPPGTLKSFEVIAVENLLWRRLFGRSRVLGLALRKDKRFVIAPGTSDIDRLLRLDAVREEYPGTESGNGEILRAGDSALLRSHKSSMIGFFAASR